jgi:hypothetical protein
MKLTRLLSTAMLFLLPGAIATVYAQEHQQEKQPAAHQQQAKPAQQQEQAKPAKQTQQVQHQQQAKPAQQPQRAARTQQAKPAQQQQRSQGQQRAQGQQRGQQQQASRGQAAGGHGSIPEARYNASFGSGHTFHVNRSEFANGSGRFNYGGYWFNAVNPWPVGWLYTDAVYVAYLNGGYFLCDPFHPGVYLSINIAI